MHQDARAIGQGRAAAGQPQGVAGADAKDHSPGSVQGLGAAETDRRGGSEGGMPHLYRPIQDSYSNIF